MHVTNRIYGSTYRDIGLVLTEWHISYNISLSYWFGKLTMIISKDGGV